MHFRKKYTGVNSIEFYKYFQTDNDCLKYLSAIKWEIDYSCKKCGNTTYCKGEKPYSRRCNKCKYDESPTADTMFDKIKFSLFATKKGLSEFRTDTIKERKKL
jgi:hypothetical protein